MSKYIIEIKDLTKNNVAIEKYEVIKDELTQEDVVSQFPHRRAYQNSEIDRIMLQQDIEEPYLSQILETWGDAPTIIPPKEPDVPLETIKNLKIQEMSDTCNKTITNGIDVELSIGNKHFSLTTEDQMNLFAKQVQISSGVETFEYHADDEPCIFFSKEDMLKIIETAMKFVSYHTTYFNSLKEYINSLQTKEEIDNIYYGIEIPEEYQSEVLKEYIISMGL